MKIAKLSTDRIVLVLSAPRSVLFASGKFVLVSNVLTDNPRRFDPYWVPATLVVWVLDFPTQQKGQDAQNNSHQVGWRAE
jgi:hypothetical protein